MKELLRLLLLYKGTFRLLTTPLTGKSFGLLTLTLVLSFSGCLFGGKSETTEVVTAPQPGLSTKTPSPPPTQEPEKAKEPYAIPAETQELHDDILSRLGSLERDYQFLRDKVSMLEFLIGEASKDSKKTKGEVQAELEKLRAQISEYNALMLRILDRISKEPKKQETFKASP